ncbi:MAG: TonB-dependent receptor plug domain-containing protein [Chthoniobacterales bacterium]
MSLNPFARGKKYLEEIYRSSLRAQQQRALRGRSGRSQLPQSHRHARHRAGHCIGNRPHIVTGGEIERSSADTAQAVTVLNEDQLKQKAAASLGDTLASQPGVAASGFAPGASRPVIRGLADNRVRVLNDGTEVFDVSNLSRITRRA